MHSMFFREKKSYHHFN